MGMLRELNTIGLVLEIDAWLPAGVLIEPNPKLIPCDRRTGPPWLVYVVHTVAPLAVQTASWQEVPAKVQFNSDCVKPAAALILARANWLAISLALDDER